MSYHMDEMDNPIEHLSTLLHTDEVRVAEFALAQGVAGPYHFHTHVTEHCLCLEGVIQIEERDDQHQILHVGARLEMWKGVVHRVRNLSSTPCRYLVIQGVGVYDFHATE